MYVDLRKLILIEVPLREGPRRQGASWVVYGSGAPSYDFLNLYDVFNSMFSPRHVFSKKRLRNGST